MATKKGAQRVALGDQTIGVSKLHLNLRNPRHEPAPSEQAAIEKLCNEELVSELAADIARRGALSPLEVLGVMPMSGNPGHYISLEGNRRTCALLVLADPSRAPVRFQAQLRRLAQRATIPREIKVHVFQDEAAAKQWIDLRHLGQQGGAGTKEWTPTQQARAAGTARQSSATANKLALDVLDRLEKRALLTSDQREAVSLTTLTRYLGTPGVRAIVGLGGSKELIYTHDADEVDRSLQRIALDSIEPLADGSYLVNSRSDSAERLQYAHDLRSRGFAPSTPQSTAKPPPKATKMAAAPSSKERRRSANNPANRAYVLTSSFTVKHKDKILLRLRDEASRLPIASFPFSTNYLLRAIVERILILFAKRFGRLQPKMSDEQLVATCVAQLEALSAPNSVLATVRKAQNRDADFSLHTLGHAVHGGIVPTDASIKAKFDTWEPALRFMLDNI